jgi:hypothetical protein
LRVSRKERSMKSPNRERRVDPRRRAIVVAIPATVLGACAGLPAVSGSPAPAPALAVGDRWTYSCSDGYRTPVRWTETHEIIAIDASGIAVRVTGRGDTMDFERVELFAAPGRMLIGAVYDNAETRRFASALTVYRFPLTPGDTWNETVANFDDLRHKNDVVNRYVKVGGHETIATPAGTFDTVAMRVFMSVDVDDPFRFPTQCTYEIWYSPQAGAAVRETKRASYIERTSGIDAAQVRTQNTVIELASYSRRGG